MEFKTVSIVIYFTINVINCEFQTNIFNVHKDINIIGNMSTLLSIPTRSVVNCAETCLKTDNCCACSYDISTETCIIDTNHDGFVQTNISNGAMTLIKDHKVSPIADCSDLPHGQTSGIYSIHPSSLLTYDVWCDMDTDNGGWTVFQRRINGTVDFYRVWSEYEDGFGDLNSEFWLGNEKISQILASGMYKLRVVLEDFDGNARYAVYNNFKIGDATTKYKLEVSGYSGTAGDSLNYHNNLPFTTYDSDNDQTNGNCAITYKGAWWYNRCHSSNLNGAYLGGAHASFADGIEWKKWRGHYYSLKSTKLMFRRLC